MGIRLAKVAIFVAIKNEYDAIVGHLKSLERLHCPQSATDYKKGLFNGKQCDWEVAVHVTGAGQTEASYETNAIISAFQPDIILFVGVAGGVPGKVVVGDIVVPTKIDYYEPGKIKTDRKVIRPQQHSPSRRLIQAARQEAYDSLWQSRLKARPNTNVYLEPMVTGESVVASTKNEAWQQIAQQFDKAVAVDMEGHGFFYSQFQREVPGIEIRGISDLLDNKNKGAESDDNRHQIMAASHAAAFAFELLSNLDTTWLDLSEDTEYVSLTMVAKTTKENANKIQKKLCELLNDNDVEITKIDYGSVVITFRMRAESARMLLSAWKGKLLAPFLPYPIVEVKISEEAPLTRQMEEALNFIENLNANPESLQNHDLSAVSERWQFFIKKILAKKPRGKGSDRVFKTIRVTPDLENLVSELADEKNVTKYRVIMDALEKGLATLQHESVKKDSHHELWELADIGPKSEVLRFGISSSQVDSIKQQMEVYGFKYFAQAFRWIFLIGFTSMKGLEGSQTSLDLKSKAMDSN